MIYPDKFINKVLCGDCLDIMPFIPDKSIDMILCDLPYGTTACKWDVIIPFEHLWRIYNRIIKPGGGILLFGNEPFSSFMRLSNIKNYKHEWIWNKEVSGNFIQAKNHPLKTTENIICFSIGKVHYYPIIEDANPKNIRPQNKKEQKTEFLGKVSNGWFIPKSDKQKRFPKHLITFNGRTGDLNNVNRIHPTQKPVPLCEYLIKTYTNEGELVLDNCAGSGTTGEACINTNRNFILIEKEQKYAKIAQERIHNAMV